MDPGKAMQNAYIESFNGKLWDECVSQQRFVNLEEAISERQVHYNERCPHGSLQYQMLAEFATKCSSKQPAELSF
jgi:putative transposase